MGSDDEFGRDTAAIRAWLDKRATYAADRAALRPSGTPTATVAAPAQAAAAPARPRIPDSRDAGRAVVELLGPAVVAAPAAPTTEPAPPAPAPAPPVEQAPGAPPAPRHPSIPTAPEPQPAAEPAPAQRVTDTATETMAEDDLPPAVIAFRPRDRARRVVSVVLLLALVAAGAAAAWAGSQRTPGAIGVAAVLVLLALVVWGVRATTAPTRLTIRRNQLEVVRAGERAVLDLASPFTPIAVLGSPGRRGWRVLIERLDAPVLELTAADVEPEPFLRVLYRLRPDLRVSTSPAGEQH